MKWINLIIVIVCSPIILLGILFTTLLSSNIIILNIVSVFISNSIIYFNLRNNEKPIYDYIYIIYPIIFLLFSLFICNHSIYILIFSVFILFLSSKFGSNIKYNTIPYIYMHYYIMADFAFMGLYVIDKNIIK